MARVAASIAELGVGTFDAERAVLDLGAEKIHLRWLDSEALWLGDEQITITFADLDPMDLSDSPEGVWDYLADPVSPPRYAWSFAPRAIRGAQAAYAAGLTLQEKIDADFWIWDPGGDFDIAVVYYSMDDGDSISPEIVPDDSGAGRNVGTPMPGVPTIRCMTSTGWVDCPIDTPTEANLAPHLYSRCNDQADRGGARVERLVAYIRWVGIP